MSNDRKKDALLSMIAPPKPRVTPANEDSKTQALSEVLVENDTEHQERTKSKKATKQKSTPDFSKMHKAGVKLDPVAGKAARESERMLTSVSMKKDHYQRLKIAAVMEGRSLKSFFDEALDDYILKIDSRLPKIDSN